jgi:hypothetical protein
VSRIFSSILPSSASNFANFPTAADMDIITAVLLTIITWVQTYRRFQKLASVFLPTSIVNCKASRPRAGASGPTNDSI